MDHADRLDVGLGPWFADQSQKDALSALQSAGVGGEPVVHSYDVDLDVQDALPLHATIEANNRYSANTAQLRLIGEDDIADKFAHHRQRETAGIFHGDAFGQRAPVAPSPCYGNITMEPTVRRPSRSR